MVASPIRALSGLEAYKTALDLVHLSEDLFPHFNLVFPRQHWWAYFGLMLRRISSSVSIRLQKTWTLRSVAFSGRRTDTVGRRALNRTALVSRVGTCLRDFAAQENPKFSLKTSSRTTGSQERKVISLGRSMASKVIWEKHPA